MASDDEDDYLSEKFIAQLEKPSSSKAKPDRGPLSYAERRRLAQRESETKNLAHRVRSRREIEEESRREGLGKSLFERAREEEAERATKRRKPNDNQDDEGEYEDDDAPAKPVNKAYAMMLKMGFKEGTALGKPSDAPTEGEGAKGLIEPLPLAMWAGKQGLGTGTRIFAIKRPGVAAPEDETGVKISQEAYRNRAREEFEEKRDFGRLASARKTLLNLDEKAGERFNILWIDPSDVDTIPDDLRARLGRENALYLSNLAVSNDLNKGEAARLRAQMRADALRPLTSEDAELDEPPPKPKPSEPQLVVDDDTLQDVKDWLQLGTRHRLGFTLDHLREVHSYCFWCGAQYEDAEEMTRLCPGDNEDAHD